jgi:hypothetical protein
MLQPQIFTYFSLKAASLRDESVFRSRPWAEAARLLFYSRDARSGPAPKLSIGFKGWTNPGFTLELIELYSLEFHPDGADKNIRFCF